ncbi:MAG: HDOD domain-containing protein [Oligoflexales bacterium]
MKEKKVCGNCKKEFLRSEDFLESTSNWRLSEDERLWFNCDCGSTMCLPKGGYPWYSPSLKLSPEAKSIFNQIPKLETLPNIPSTIIEIQNALLSEEYDVDELVKLVKIEPFTLTEVLYVYNSLRLVKKERKQREVSVKHAIIYIGKKRLSSIILRSMFKKLRFKTKVFPLDTFWQDSFLTGLISEQLWMHFKSKFDRDRAFIAGYLCNIGKMAGVIVFPEKMDNLWIQIKDIKHQDTWVNLEKKVPLIDHCLLGEIAAAFWGFPDFTFNPIKHHHNPGLRSNEGDGFLCHIVALANYIKHWIMLEPHLIDEHGIHQCEAYFNINSQQTQEIVSKLQEQLYVIS